MQKIILTLLLLEINSFGHLILLRSCYRVWQNDGSNEGKELPILNALVSGQQSIRLQQPFQDTKNYFFIICHIY